MRVCIETAALSSRKHELVPLLRHRVTLDVGTLKKMMTVLSHPRLLNTLRKKPRVIQLKSTYNGE